jgi:hypothetical protein
MMKQIKEVSPDFLTLNLYSTWHVTQEFLMIKTSFNGNSEQIYDRDFLKWVKY